MIYCQNCGKNEVVFMVMPPDKEYIKPVGNEPTRFISGCHSARKFLCGWCASAEVESRQDMVLIPLGKHTPYKPKPVSEEALKHIQKIIKSL